MQSQVCKAFCRHAQFASMNAKLFHLNSSFSRSTRIGVLFGICLSVCSLAVAQDTKLTTAEAAVQARIAKSGADVGGFFKALDGKGPGVGCACDGFYAARTLKISVMI